MKWKWKIFQQYLGLVNERHKMFNGNHNKQANEKEQKYWNCKVWTVQENGRQRASKRHAKVYLLRVFVVSWMVKCRHSTLIGNHLPRVSVNMRTSLIVVYVETT